MSTSAAVFTAFWTYVAEKGLEVLLTMSMEKIVQEVSASFSDDPEAKQILRSALASRSLVNSIRRQFSMADRRGILIIGPSGVGKSHIYHGLLERTRTKGTSSTQRMQGGYRGFGSRITRVVDTAGDFEHDVEDTVTRMTQRPPRILILVFAGGFHETVLKTQVPGGKLWRPHLDQEFNSLADFLSYTAKEEEDWLKILIRRLEKKKFQKKAQDIVVVLNKNDLWADKRRQVLARYQDGEIADLIAKFSKLATIQRTSGQVLLSAQYNSFFGRVAPARAFSVELSTRSLDIFTYQLAARIDELRSSK